MQCILVQQNLQCYFKEASQIILPQKYLKIHDEYTEV